MSIAEFIRPLNQFVDLLPVGVCIIDDEKKVRLWNRTIAGWSGRSTEEMVGEHLDRIYPHLDAPRYRYRIEQVLDGGPPAVFSSQLNAPFIPCPLPDGGMRLQHTSVIRQDRTDGVLAIIIIEDITELGHEIVRARSMRDQALGEVEERKKVEKALLFTNRKLNLLSGITRHDILNEVTVLLGNATFLDELLPDGTDEKKYLNTILRSTKRIQDQITFTSDYEGLGGEEPGWFDIRDVALKAFSLIGSDTITLDVQEGCFQVFADPMLEKVFFSLFENALRHGGGVTTITIRYHICEDESVISVTDDGAGIAENFRERLFERGFGRNTGLGLFLSKEILEITSISIEEAGREGEGARFLIHVPNDKVRREKQS
ncbi:PAS domain S-box-containing protein [Methanocalculus alkaliphilus]|uniref:ATP-binding protein n=1 Tax=Methanocalculus alkaliphilus TaxID=768730 RepID=UPI00209DF7AB|nr:PAS domain-containing sensor histidine kinase [Methanocalculus alkaliphilus]MCP1714235.1 PAS domain S-box-containing protein [Methanocalculus alkaliphilus]